jgi:hypothetical protein
MYVRLGFAIAAFMEPEILLVDEVLAVGDARFQEKCFGAFADFRRRGKTVVLVSHDLGAIQRFCDRVFWIDRGRLVMAGEAAEVVQTYLAASRSGGGARREEAKTAELPPGRFGDGGVRFVRGVLENEHGVSLARVHAGARVALRLSIECTEPSEDPVVGFGVRRLGGAGTQTIYSISSELLGIRTGRFLPGDRIEVRMPFTAALLNGHYAITVAIAKRADEAGSWAFHDWVSDFVTFAVENSPCIEGLVDLGAEFESEAAGPVAAQIGRP